MKLKSAILSLTMAALAARCGGDVQPAAEPVQSFVPQAVSCGTSCPPGRSYQSLVECATPGRAADATLGCANLVTKCYCTRSVELMPKVLVLP